MRFFFRDFGSSPNPKKSPRFYVSIFFRRAMSTFLEAISNEATINGRCIVSIIAKVVNDSKYRLNKIIKTEEHLKMVSRVPPGEAELYNLVRLVELFVLSAMREIGATDLHDRGVYAAVAVAMLNKMFTFKYRDIVKFDVANCLLIADDERLHHLVARVFCRSETGRTWTCTCDPAGWYLGILGLNITKLRVNEPAREMSHLEGEELKESRRLLIMGQLWHNRKDDFAFFKTLWSSLHQTSKDIIAICLCFIQQVR